MSRYPQVSLTEIWRLAMLALFYAMVRYSVRTPSAARSVFICCHMALLLVVTYGIMQRLGHDLFAFTNDPKNRLISSMGNPNMLAAFLLLMFWLGFGVALDAKRRSYLLFLLLLSGATLVCLVLTYTKGAWLALLATMVIGGLSRSRLVPQLRVSRCQRRIVLAFVLIGLLCGVFLGRRVISRLPTLIDSAKLRIVFWRGALRLVGDRPFLGSGTGTFHVVFPTKRASTFREQGAGYNTRHAHCEPLQILTETGVIGLIAFSWLVFVFCRGVLRTLASRKGFLHSDALAGMTLAVTALPLHNLVDVNLRWYVAPMFFWLFLALSANMSTMSSGLQEARDGRGQPHVFFLPFSFRVVFCFSLAILLAGCIKVRSIAPFVSEVHTRTALELAGKAKWRAAIDHVRKSICANPQNLQALYLKSYCHFESREYGEALRDLLRLETYAPDYSQLQYYIGMMYGFLGQWGEATERFSRAERAGIMPSGISCENLIEVLTSKKPEDTKSVALIRAHADMNPNDPSAQNHLGLYYFEHDILDMGEEAFKLSLKADAEFIPALNNLAGVHYRRKNYDEALALCRAILRIDRKALKVRINLGRIYYARGQKEDAITEWEQVVSQDPSESEAITCLREAGAWLDE